MSEQQPKEGKDGKMSEKFVTPDKGSIIVRRKRKPAEPTPKKGKQS